ncbi:MAG: succinate dehydrogenase [Deltaproteobacteria bacterium RBG_13_49_15]|nr:MAG: succinate dehydrogenase [Deltaproteobacteria bacterium RBG_13_49_15]
MSWLFSFIWSSLGRKLLMALTGFCFCMFLVMHLFGNLMLYGGRDAFNGYAEKLHQLGVLVTVFELGLLTFGIIHVLTGSILFYQNFAARPVRYAVRASGGGQTLGSATMPYTGFLVLVFVVFHLIDFHFADRTNATIYDIVSTAFHDPFHLATYIFVMIVVAVHVSHGFWSAFQTFGLNHVKYMPLIKGLSLAFAFVVGLGFGFIPIYIALFRGQ